MPQHFQMGSGIKSTQQIFKTGIIIHFSKTNLDVKNLFGKINHLLDQEISKMQERGLMGMHIPHSTLVHDLLPLRFNLDFRSEY